MWDHKPATAGKGLVLASAHSSTLLACKRLKRLLAQDTPFIWLTAVPDTRDSRPAARGNAGKWPSRQTFSGRRG